ALAAEQARLAELGDIESIQQAVELSNRIADPRNWRQLHSELSTMAAEYGITLEEAAQVDAEAREIVGTPPLDVGDDSELAPLMRELQQMRGEVSSLREEREAQIREAADMEAAEREHNAILGEVTRQENAILTSNPHYDDEDMNEIYRISSFFNGDL